MKIPPLPLISALKHASPEMSRTFTQGSCYQLYLILLTVYPSATPLYSDTEGHWITRIYDDEHADHRGAPRYFDIHGEIREDYVKEKDFGVRSKYVRESSKVCRYGEGGVAYSKYLRSV